MTARKLSVFKKHIGRLPLIAVFLLFCMGACHTASAQDAEFAFHAGAQKYIDGDVRTAKQIVQDALRYDPDNPKLNELLKKLEEKEKQQQQQQQQQQQSGRNEEKQEEKDKGEQSEENQDEQQAKNKPENGEPSEDNKEGQNEQDQPPMGQPSNPEELRISKEKARMILEALRNQEIQYIQQQRKEAQKPAETNKPDW